MKKTICCAVLCMALLTACTPAQTEQTGTDTPRNNGTATTLSTNNLIPAAAHTMTVSYADDTDPDNAQEKKSYVADQEQYRQFCDLLGTADAVELTDTDALSFSYSKNPGAAVLSVTFDTGEVLFIDAEGVISCYPEQIRSAPLPGPTRYFVSDDVIHQLQRILIPDFEKVYCAIPMDSKYVKTEDVNPGNVDEISFFLPQGRKIYAVSDGFIALNRVWGGDEAHSFLRTVKYDKHGSFLWSQDYTDITLPFWCFSSGCIETKDGGFAFYLTGEIWYTSAGSGTSENQQVAVTTPSRLVKCDHDGQILWNNQIEFKGGNEIQWIGETQNGAILTAGVCESEYVAYDEINCITSDTVDLLLMRYEKNGAHTEKKIFGGTDYESFSGACYAPEVGWVVWGFTQSCDRDFTQRKEKGEMLTGVEFMTVFDENINEKGQYIFEGEEDLITSYVTIADQQIYITGTLKSAATAKCGAGKQAVVFKFNPDATVADSIRFPVSDVMGIYTAGDGTLLLPFSSPANDDTSAESQVYKLDKNLAVIQTIRDTAAGGYSYTLIPTEDHGFFTVQSQSVKYLPQPPWMNRITTDSMTILSRYDAAGTLLYRKSYDKNHEVETMDTVIPLLDGRVVVGR
ncbi:MAG: hypothetical protein QM689_06630 [Oscillospiraceae bacterium]